MSSINPNAPPTTPPASSSGSGMFGTPMSGTLWGAGIGGVIGAVVGLGVFSVPAALMGAAIGATIGSTIGGMIGMFHQGKQQEAQAEQMMNTMTGQQQAGTGQYMQWWSSQQQATNNALLQQRQFQAQMGAGLPGGPASTSGALGYAYQSGYATPNGGMNGITPQVWSYLAQIMGPSFSYAVNAGNLGTMVPQDLVGATPAPFYQTGPYSMPGQFSMPGQYSMTAQYTQAFAARRFAA